MKTPMPPGLYETTDLSMPGEPHPNTLAAHMRGSGFKSAKVDRRSGYTDSPGFSIGHYVEPHLLTLRHLTASGLDGLGIRAELDKMIAALAPEFEVVADLRNRVVVRRAVKP